jgi:renalase
LATNIDVVTRQRAAIINGKKLSNQSNRHIAIIGAGLAGLSCATALQHAGLTVSVFEKSRRAAGRMSTRRGNDDSAPWQCDHGAQYFTARDPEFQTEVARWCEAGAAALWTPRLKILDGKTQRGISQTDSEQIQRYVGVPRMTSPANFIAEKIALTTQSTIKQLQRDEDGWRLVSAEYGLIENRFDAVLLAIPAPQAAVLLQSVAPAFTAIATATNMRGCWTVMLQFASPISLPFDAAFVHSNALSWIARDSSKPGRAGLESWVLQASPEWSEAHLEDAADDVAATLINAFVTLGGPIPSTWIAHRWRYASTEPAQERGCAWDATLSIGMCGDWLNGGKVEGAWLSGRRLAEQVITQFSANGAAD